VSITFEWARMESMTPRQIYDILGAREAVFVVEQACPYQEIDGADFASWHLSVRSDGELAGYARVVAPGVKYDDPSIGRVMTVGKFRALKIGRQLMAEAIRFTAATYPDRNIRIGAQARLQDFYESLGFVRTSEIYSEDGIPHIEMTRCAASG